MRVEYDATLDEILDLHLLQDGESAIQGRMRVRLRISAGLIVAVVVAALAPESILLRVLWGLAAGAIVVIISPYTLRGAQKKIGREYLKEQLGGEGPIPFCCELTEEALVIDQGEIHLRYRWDAVERIEETEDGILLRMSQGGLVMVRERAFVTPTQRTEFVQLARKCISMASATVADNPPMKEGS